MKKHFIVRYVTADGDSYYLDRTGKTLYWHNVLGDKEYKTLGRARNKALYLHRRFLRADRKGAIEVCEVTFRPTNPLLPDGFHEPVKTPVYRLNC